MAILNEAGSYGMGVQMTQPFTGLTPELLADEINDVQMELRKDAGDASALRELLLSIAGDAGYAEWLSREQFDGRPFVHPPGLDFALLERLALAKERNLAVRVNVCDDLALVTDGLWVDAAHRVFPFADESGLLKARCDRLGWSDWATCLIDPATGCGHNLLRYQGTARRYGFDVNARSLSYAAVNATLNSVPVALLGLNDVQDGLPAVFTALGPERVLMIANMPFELSPLRDALPPSAEGGYFGYELTRAALNAAAGLEEQLGPDSRLRCLVLTYSVGCLDEQRWAVTEHAERCFGADRVAWHPLPSESLWRVNGKKQQPNPMPLENLALKADCRFDVRDPSRREEIREGYRTLVRDCARNGWDHLAYGIVEVTDSRAS